MKTRSNIDSSVKTNCSNEDAKGGKCKLSRTEIMQRYRQKIKENPEKIEMARAKDRDRKRLKRLQQREEIVNGNRALHEHIKSQNKKHMKTYRRNLKCKKAKNTKAEEKKLGDERSGLKKQRAVMKTQRWRMRIKLAHAEKDSRAETNEGTNEAGLNTDFEGLNPGENDQEMTEDADKVKSPSRWTLYRTRKAASKLLPSTPVKKAAIVESIIESPRTANILYEKGICISGEAKKKLDVALDIMEGTKLHIEETKPSGTQESQKKTAYDAIINTCMRSAKKKTQMLKSLGLSKNRKNKHSHDWWQKNPRKQRKDRTSDLVKSRVSQFYLSQEVSREVPNKKEVLCLKEGNKKEYVQKHIMTMTTADAYHTYKNKYPNDKIGFSTFKKLKPEQVRRVSETSRRSCLCQICCNVALKSEALKSYLSLEKFKDIEKPPSEKQELLKLTLCEIADQKYYKSQCLRRECSECGTQKLREAFETVSRESAQGNCEITWYKWEHITVDKEDNSSKRIISCVPKCSSFNDFLIDLENCMKEYPSHKFRATWQHDQLLKCLASLKEKQLMTIMDFSENYKCSFQNEVQSAYFDQNLVTIHPSMNYYKKKIEDDKEILIKHTIVGISNDLKHDSTLVRIFENKSLNIIEKEIDIESVIQWSDGCAAQYKSKVGFSYLSQRQYKMSRNFFETSHGKNVCDGLGAIVKNACFRAMLTGKVIGNAVDLFNHCKETLAHDLKINKAESTGTIREFIYVSKDEVDRTNIPNVSTLVGTRKLHCIRNTETPLTLESRNLSCYCQACLNADPCENFDYVESWKRSCLKPTQQKSTFRQMEPTCASSHIEHASPNAATIPLPVHSASKNLHANLERNGSDEYKVDDYVSVQLGESKSRRNLFVGQIIEMDGNTGEFKISFMAKAPALRESLYFWPDKKDESWEALSSITRKLGIPVLSNKSTNRRVLFSFNED